jgi:ATP-dependent helicase HrpA
VPLYALNQVDARRCEWLVPGMIKEKAQLLLRSLPQKLRRHCVPLPNYAAGFADRAAFGVGNVVDALIADLREQVQVQARTSDFKLESLPTHLFMNFKVIDEHGRQLAMARNLAQLRAELGAQAQQEFQKIAAAHRDTQSVEAGGDAEDGRVASGRGVGAGALKGVPSTAAGRPGSAAAATGAGHSGASASTAGRGATQQPAAGRTKGNAGEAAPRAADAAAGSESTALYENLTTWNFGTLPELLEVRRRGQTMFGYPALVDRGDHCDVEVFDSPEEAARIHRAGLRRLFALQLREPIKFLEKNIPGIQQMAMQYMALGTQEELRDQIVECALDRACLQEPLPVDAQSFAARRDEGRSRLSLLAQEIARLASSILTEHAAATKKLVQAKSFAAAYADMTQQLQSLVGKRFLIDTPYAQLVHFPRYLKAISMRIDKLKADAARDARQAAEMAPLLQQFQRTVTQRKSIADPRLVEFRWLLEELRVSLFAQELRTPMPVSVKRLHKVWDALER